jgi:small conductance mechanosensitive channel
MDFESFIDQLVRGAANYVPKIVLAIIVLFIGLKVTKWIVSLVEKSLNKVDMDATLKPFLVSLTKACLKILIVIIVLPILGIEMTSFIAILGAASLAIGLAFQGALSNFAGGILILTLRPFKVGDFIDANGFKGTVEAIHVLNTVIVTPDNRVINMPNGNLANTTIVNVNEKPTRRVDINFGVGYDADLDHVTKVLTEVTNEHALILKDPACFIKVLEHADSAVVFVVRAWVNTADYWTVYFDLMETVKKRFDEEKISIPFPQVDVHMQQ